MLVWEGVNANHKRACAGLKDRSMERWVVCTRDIGTLSHQSRIFTVTFQAQTEALAEIMNKAFLAMAAPRQGEGSQSGNKPPGTGHCFDCDQEGPFKHDGLVGKKRPFVRPLPTTPCPCCKKGNHWKNDCRSKFNKEGRPLN